MKKMHIVKQREKNPAQESPYNDLRGFGHEINSQKNVAYPCLSLRYLTDIDISEIILQYDLRFMGSKHKDIVHILTNNRGENEYKMQTLILFFAALKLADITPETQFLLHQVNQFHDNLMDKINPKAKNIYQPDTQITTWKNSSSKITIQAPCQLYLRQADLPITPQETDLNLNDQDITSIKNEIFQNLEKVNLRKVG